MEFKHILIVNGCFFFVKFPFTMIKSTASDKIIVMDILSRSFDHNKSVNLLSCRIEKGKNVSANWWVMPTKNPCLMGLYIFQRIGRPVPCLSIRKEKKVLSKCYGWIWDWPIQVWVSKDYTWLQNGKSSFKVNVLITHIYTCSFLALILNLRRGSVGVKCFIRLLKKALLKNWISAWRHLL